MRVALVHSRYGSAEPSGENSVVDNEHAALARAGVDVRLLERATDDVDREPLRRTRAALRVGTGRGASPLDELRGWKPDVVHLHNLFPNYGTGWLSGLECPFVVTVHNFRPVCAAGILFRDGHPCTDCLAAGKQSALLHRCYRGSLAATLPLVASQRRDLGEDRVLGQAAKVITLSRRTADLYVSRGLPADRIVVWPNFLPDDRRLPPSAEPPEDYFVFVGRLRVEKGIVRLLQRWPADVRLIVVGDGPDRAAAEAAGSGKPVEFTGAVAPERVRELLERAQALVFPSIVQEQFPMTYLEALAAGTPVLAFDTNALSDLVAADGTGVVCSWDDDLSTALASMRRAPLRNTPSADATWRRYGEGAYVDRAVGLYRSLL